ncbi:PadR family transcriptional regulator [Micromonospora humidisoli]|uniref:PadR family transcriptional regulator n=1 Tax=Micromonospora humidisoli TaxID=2807622 RepID=A0ABS2JGC6_9ACTN|nr:PadR family transcriptional regulator [Micromonospora humidisoli]MBM7085577.1 PadR family transcriptional regulator [Micromonospora humidisoli]
MATAHLILGLLANQPRHGYDVKTLHSQRFPRVKPLALGQVYATLHRLERDGLIRLARRDRRCGPERNTYAVTEAGLFVFYSPSTDQHRDRSRRSRRRRLSGPSRRPLDCPSR